MYRSSRLPGGRQVPHAMPHQMPVGMFHLLSAAMTSSLGSFWQQGLLMLAGGSGGTRLTGHLPIPLTYEGRPLHC